MRRALVLIHGAFQKGSVWKLIIPYMEACNYDVISPTLEGKTLTDHVNQVRDCVLSLNRPVTLLGHSYGSLVVTSTARLLPDSIEHLVLLDSPIPFSAAGEHQSLLDILGPDATEVFLSRTVDCRVQPFPPEAFGLDAKIHAEHVDELCEQHLACFTEKGASWCPADKYPFPIAYVQCAPNPFTQSQVEIAKRLGWQVLTLPEAGHCPMITHAQALFILLRDSGLIES